MQAVVLAAGRGTRLRPITSSRSKAMVPVLGRPLAEWAVVPFYENGIRDFVFVISPEDTEIRGYFTQRTRLDITARFTIQKERLGTAHALGIAAPLLGGRFAVTACDSLIAGSHVEALLSEAGGPDAVLSLLDLEPELVARSASVSLEGRTITRIVEKPRPGRQPSNTVSLPHYVFSPRLLDFLPEIGVSPRGEYELADAVQGLIDTGGEVVGIHAEERQQVSSPEDLLNLTRLCFARCRQTQKVTPAAVVSGSRLVEPLYVEDGAVVGDGCELGPEVFLESGCEIGRGAVVRRSIVLRGGRVAEGETIEDRVVV